MGSLIHQEFQGKNNEFEDSNRNNPKSNTQKENRLKKMREPQWHMGQYKIVVPWKGMGWRKNIWRNNGQKSSKINETCKPQVQEGQRGPSRINIKEATPGQIIITLVKNMW